MGHAYPIDENKIEAELENKIEFVFVFISECDVLHCLTCYPGEDGTTACIECLNGYFLDSMGHCTREYNCRPL